MTINSTHISFCNNVEGKQTHYSYALRPMVGALGIITTIGGIIGMYTFGSLGGGLLIGGGGLLVLLGLSLSCVSKKGEEDSINAIPTTTAHIPSKPIHTDHIPLRPTQPNYHQEYDLSYFEKRAEEDTQKLKEMKQMLKDQEIREKEAIERQSNIVKEHKSRFDQSAEEAKATLDEIRSRFNRNN